MTFLRNAISTAAWPLSAALEAHRASRTLRILTYHRVNDDLDWDRLTVSTENFSQQLQYLKAQGYETIHIADYLKSRDCDEDFSKKIVLTFDDGYEDNYRLALPVLKSFGMVATFFLTTSYIGSAKTFPRYENKSGGHRFMTWEEVRALLDAGMQIGSHTMTHCKLGHVEESLAEIEITESRDALLAQGVCADWFCYPFGSFSETAVEAVRKAGFRAALTTMPGVNSMKQCDYLLKRTEVSGDDRLFDFRKKLAGAFDFTHTLRHYFNQRTMKAT